MRQKIKLIIALSITMLAAIFSIFVFNSKVYAGSGTGILSLDSELVGTWDNTSEDNHIPNNTEYKKLKKYVSGLSMYVMMDGTISLSVGYWRYLYNESYVWGGSETHTDEVRAGTCISYDDESWDIGGDSTYYHNHTKNFTNSFNGCNIIIELNNIKKGVYISDNGTKSISGFGTLRGDCFIKIWIIYSYNSGISDQYSNDSYDIYSIYFTSTVYVGADEVAPTISGVTDGTICNTNKTLQVSDDYKFDSWKYSKAISYYSNSFSSISGTSMNFSDDGCYTIKAYDSSSNETTVKFIIDKTKPVISGIDDNGYYNSSKTITFSDATSGIYEVRINGPVVSLSNTETLGNGYTGSGKYTISEEGTYALYVCDNAGNTLYENIIIDKTLPI